MAELVHYPFVNQLNSPTLDGRADENKWFNCTISSILSAMLYRRPELYGRITPDSMKDAVLGEGYANAGTSAEEFVNFVARYGLRLYREQGNVVELAHQLVREGRPAIFTEIDPYVDTTKPAYQGWTHVCSFYKEIPGGLDAMDPFGGRIISKSDQDWSQVIVGGEVWTIDLIGQQEEKPTMSIPTGWHYDGQTTLTAPNGVKVVYGFCQHILSHNWNPANVPLGPQYYTPLLEASNPDLGGGDQIVFLYGDVLGYPHNPKDPGLKEKVIVEYAGKELVTARQQAATYYQKTKDLEQQLAKALSAAPVQQPDPKLAQYESKLSQIHAIATLS